jgi:hypothetical protein
MIVVMNMSDYEIESEAIEVDNVQETMHTGWNPEVNSVHEQLQLVPVDEQRTLPNDLTTVAAELFLRKMYSYQR